MTPYRLDSTSDFRPVLQLVQDSFAYMDARIDPPSSMHRLTVGDIRQQATAGEVWAIGAPPVACMFLTNKENCLYLGKLAVVADHRSKGLARQMVAVAVARARALDLPAVELQTRVELTENHATFTALGFTETGRTAHPGYDRPTSITFRLPVSG
ncbi:MAG: GNAT family N-acetyltransferase [Rhodobacteraceae bacterium]|nr:GNAT family N-acetyltransferase [Paracoccaceae bacterium]